MSKIGNQTIWENKKSIKTIQEYLELISAYVKAKIDNNTQESKIIENKMSLMHSRVNTVFINAGILPIRRWGNVINQRDINIVQEVPLIVRLYLGEDSLFGARTHSYDLNIIDDIRSTYISLIGLYDQAKQKAWINTILPIGLVLRLPAKIVKYLISSIFDYDIPSNNLLWKGFSLLINTIAWIATALPLIDRLGYGEEFDQLIIWVQTSIFN